MTFELSHAHHEEVANYQCLGSCNLASYVMEKDGTRGGGRITAQGVLLPEDGESYQNFFLEDMHVRCKSVKALDVPKVSLWKWVCLAGFASALVAAVV